MWNLFVIPFRHLICFVFTCYYWSVQEASYALRRNLYHIDEHSAYTLFCHWYVQYYSGLFHLNRIMTVLLGCFVESCALYWTRLIILCMNSVQGSFFVEHDLFVIEIFLWWSDCSCRWLWMPLDVLIEWLHY